LINYQLSPKLNLPITNGITSRSISITQVER